jgi:hypothetical protein
MLALFAIFEAKRITLWTHHFSKKSVACKMQCYCFMKAMSEGVDVHGKVNSKLDHFHFYKICKVIYSTVYPDKK